MGRLRFQPAAEQALRIATLQRCSMQAAADVACGDGVFSASSLVDVLNTLLSEIHVDILGVGAHVTAADLMNSRADLLDGCVIVPQREVLQQMHGRSWMQTAGGWQFKMSRGDLIYISVRPIGGSPHAAGWPYNRKKGKGSDREYQRVCWWIAHSHRGGLVKVQSNFVDESNRGMSRELVCSHLCGRSTCIRPAHLALQTRVQDCADRKHHKTARGIIRNSGVF